MPSPYMRSALLGMVLAPSLALAQATPPAADPAADTPRVEYLSVFENYRRPAGTAAGDWRHANDRVREVGGFAGSLKDDPKDRPSGGQETAPSEPGHSGHPGHSK